MLKIYLNELLNTDLFEVDAAKLAKEFPDIYKSVTEQDSTWDNVYTTYSKKDLISVFYKCRDLTPSTTIIITLE
jgi:hypothetical protein